MILLAINTYFVEDFFIDFVYVDRTTAAPEFVFEVF